MKSFIITSDVAMYFLLFYAGSRFIRAGVGQVPMTDRAAILVPGIVLLSCVTYLGTWITLAERKPDLFWKLFVAFNIVPGALGAIAGTMRLGL